MKKHWKRWLAGFLALTLAVSTGVYRSYDFKAVDPEVTTEVEQITPDIVVEEIEVADQSTEDGADGGGICRGDHGNRGNVFQ